MSVFVLLLFLRGVSGILFWSNSSGAYCASPLRTSFISPTVVEEKVLTDANLLDAAGWAALPLTHLEIAADSLTQSHIANGMTTNKMVGGVSFSWTNTKTVIELQSQKAFDFTIELDTSHTTFVCAKSCRRTSLVLYREDGFVTAVYGQQTARLNYGSGKVTLSAKEKSATVRIFNMDVLVAPSLAPNLKLDISAPNGFCLNFWQGDVEETTATLRIGTSFFPLGQGGGWQTLRIATKGRKIQGELVLALGESDAGVSFALLTSLVCPGDVVFAAQGAKGCFDERERAIITSEATVCPDYDCECGHDCLICSGTGCGCEIRRELEQCHSAKPTPPTTTLAPATTSTSTTNPSPAAPTWRPSTTVQPETPTQSGSHWILYGSLSVGGVLVLGIGLLVRRRRLAMDRLPLLNSNVVEDRYGNIPLS